MMLRWYEWVQKGVSDMDVKGENDMLVLSRQRNETIMIGDDVEITVVDIRGDKVRLGINAPRQIQVHRKEVWEAIKRENREKEEVTNLPSPPSEPTSG